jgi:hypothetical protein
MLFAHLKRILKLDRLRLRGPNGARDEFILAATDPDACPEARLGAGETNSTVSARGIYSELLSAFFTESVKTDVGVAKSHGRFTPESRHVRH